MQRTLFLQFYFSLCAINHSLYCIILTILNTGHNNSHFNNFFSLIHVSLLAGKFMEKSYLNSFFPFLSSNSMLKPFQWNFLPVQSTVLVKSPKTFMLLNPFSVLISLYAIAASGMLNYFHSLKHYSLDF